LVSDEAPALVSVTLFALGTLAKYHETKMHFPQDVKLTIAKLSARHSDDKEITKNCSRLLEKLGS
jgi:hypothetical protein